MEITSALDACERLHEDSRAESTEKFLSQFGFVGRREDMA